MFRTRFSFADALVILSVLSVAALLFLCFLRGAASDPSENRLVIHTPTEALTYPLSADRTVTVSSGNITLTVEIRDGRARVSDSDCPDKICQRTGWISRKGETVICAPAAVRLTVTDPRGGVGDADSVIG